MSLKEVHPRKFEKIEESVLSLQGNQVSAVICALQTIQHDLWIVVLLQKFIDLNGPTVTLSVMQKHPHNKKIQSPGLAVLLQVFKGHRGCDTVEVKKALIQSSVIESTVNAMTRFRLDHDLIHDGIKILTILSEIDSVEVKRALVLANAIESTVAAMKQYRLDSALAFDGLVLLTNLSENGVVEAYCDLVNEATVLSLQSNRVLVVIRALKTIRLSLRFDILFPKVVDLEGPAGTLSAMQKHPRDKDIQSLGMEVLSEFLQGCRSWRPSALGNLRRDCVTVEVKKALIHSNVIESTICAMTRFRLDHDLMRDGIKILVDLSQIDSVEVKRDLVLANAIESTVAAMKDDRSDSALVFDCLMLLTNLSANGELEAYYDVVNEALVCSKVIEITVARMKWQRSDKDFVYERLTILTNLFEKNCFQIGVDNVVTWLSSLVDVMAEARDDQYIITMGFRLLKGLVEIKELRGKLIESGAISGIAIVFDSSLHIAIKCQAKEALSTLISCM